MRKELAELQGLKWGGAINAEMTDDPELCYDHYTPKNLIGFCGKGCRVEEKIQELRSSQER